MPKKIQSKMKGIILAGGNATRLRPITSVVSKQLLPVYDKPMIYYPLSLLMLAEIKEILVISTPRDLPLYKSLLGDGSKWGLNFSFAQQDRPRGLADAFIVGKDFIGDESCCLVLGDNILYGQGLQELLKDAKSRSEGATIFGYEVKDPQRYGIVEVDSLGKATSIEEKPEKPKSKTAIIGIYFFDNSVIKIAKNLSPSKRGELEITDVHKKYMDSGNLRVKQLGRGFAWLDTGTFSSLADASEFIKVIENRQGKKICCPEEIAYKNKFIDKKQFLRLSEELKNSSYGDYLKGI